MAKESIEALLTPSLRVSRPVAACARCRSAKIKCDGKLPACSACERSGKSKECSSANDDFARGKERSYVAALETAIQKLQRKIQQAQDTSQNAKVLSAVSPQARPSVQKKPISGTRRREASDVDDLVSDFGFLTVNATSRDFHGFTSTMSFARLLMATAQKKDLLTRYDESLPLRQVSTPLVNYYFENIYVMLPFFSETDFVAASGRVFGENGGIAFPSPQDVWYVRLVLAISSASQCQEKGDAAYSAAIQHISAAMRIAEFVIHPGSVSGIQALLLLVQYALVDPEHFDSWYLIGMASRLVVDLGLHCEPSVETKITKQALDQRRRVFYCTYALDRLISMALGLAFSFTDDSAPNVLLPTLATDLEKSSPSQLFLRSIRPSLFLFDIRRVQSAFYQTTRWSARREWPPTTASDYVRSTLEDISSWHSTLPQTFNRRHLQAFYLEYLYSQIFVLSPNPVVPVACMTDGNKSRVFESSIQFAEAMGKVVQDVDVHPFLTYADVCRARFVGKQFQAIVWSDFDDMLRRPHNATFGLSMPDANPHATAIDNCNRAVSVLSNLAKVLAFARYRWDIPNLQERFQQETAVLLARLKNKQQEFTMAQHQSQPRGRLSTPDHPSQLMSRLAQPVQQFQQAAPFGAYHVPESFPVTTESNPAVHRADLFRTSSWSAENQQQSLSLPHGSLPRRSYEFLGGKE